MILLLGGTGETGEISSALAAKGFDVLVSTATGLPLKLPHSRRIQLRIGPLSETGLRALIRDMNIEAVVDATHPYACEITALASFVSSACGLPYYRYSRPPVIQKAPDIFFEKDHGAAAATAVSFGKNVLLTTGSKNLSPYVKAALQTDVRLVARVLDTQDSIRACLDAGIGSESIVPGKGPFSAADNLSVIRKFNIGVLVTKDGGIPGGVLEKLEAARAEHCSIVVVQRAPSADVEDRTWTDIGKFLDVLDGDLGSLKQRPAQHPHLTNNRYLSEP